MKFATACLVLVVAAVGATALAAQGKPNLREYSRDQVTRLSPGMSEAEVQSLIGEPTERTTEAHRVMWRYHAVYQLHACDVTLFGIIPVARRPREQYDLTLAFSAQGLEAARYVVRLPERTTTTDLLPSAERQ